MNMNSIVVKGAGVAIVVVGAGLVLLIGHSSGPKTPVIQPSAGSSTTIVEPSGTASAPVVHTADWYVAHPDVLKEDEKKCAGDASVMPQAACQNVSSADARLTALEMQKAADENAAPPASKTASKPSQ